MAPHVFSLPPMGSKTVVCTHLWYLS